MRHVSVLSEHPIFTGFRGLMGCQRDPRDRGVAAGYKSLGIRIPRTRWGMGLHHEVIVHFGELICVMCA